MNEFYVYLYLREDDTPYYVGKGKGKRAFKNWGRRAKVPANKTKIIFHSKNLTEEEAFRIEKELIAQYGRKDNGTGILRNLTDGGDGTSGFICSNQRRIEMSEKAKEAMNRPEVRAKVSEKTKEAMSRPEVKAKLSEHAQKTKERMSRPEVRAKLSETIKKSLSRPEVKAKLSNAQKKRFSNSEERIKQLEKIKIAMIRPEVKDKISVGMKEYYRKKREAEQASANTLTKFFSE